MAVINSLDTSAGISGNIDALFGDGTKTITDVYDALVGKGKDTILAISKKIETNTNLVVKTLTMGVQHLASIDDSLSANINQGALLSVELSANGDAKDFMQSLTKLSDIDDIKLVSIANGLESIGVALEKTISKDYSKSATMVSSLDAMTVGLVKFTSSLPSFKTFGGIAGGLALLGLSIAGFIGAIGIEDVLIMGATFLAISLSSKLLEGTSTNLLKASFGVATLGLSLWAFNTLIDADTLITFGASLVAFGTSIWLYDKMFGKASLRTSAYLIELAVGVGALGVALWTYKSVETASIGKVALALSGIGLASMILKKAKFDATDSVNLIGLSLAVGVLGVSLLPYKHISVEDVGVSILALGGMAVVGMLLGKLGTSAIQGAISIGAMAVSLGILAWGLTQMQAVDMSLEDAFTMATTIGLTVGAISLIGLMAVPIAIGSAVALGMGIGVGALALALMSVSTVTVTEQQAQTFKDSVILVKDAIASIGETGGTIDLAFGLAQSVLIAGSTIPLVFAMNMLSAMKTPSVEVMNGFDRTIISLKNTFTQFGVMDLTEMALVTPVMLLLATTTVALGTAISLFAFLSTDEDSAKNAILTLDSFLGGMFTTFSKYDDSAFETLSKGIKATMGMGMLLKNLAYGIGAISVEMEKNTDFTAIGVSVGKMLTALTEPLAAIGGSNDELISIGGFSISNPFSNKVEKGIEALSNIGSVFNPLAVMLKVFAENTDGDIVTKFSTNIRGIFGAMSEIFKEYSVDEESGTNTQFLESVNASNKFLGVVTNGNYEPASKGLKSIAESTLKFKTSVNEMDFDKLSKLSDLFKNMRLLNDSQGMQDLIEALSEFTETLIVNGGSTNTKTVTVKESSSDGADKKTTPSTNKVIDKDTKQNELASIISDGNTDMITKLQDLLTYLKSGQLKVNVKGQNNI